MKYMLLIYSDENAWTETEQQECYAESVQLTHQLQANGQYLGASPLESVSTATSVRVRNGKQMVTDGPFAETREQLGGYFLINARDLNEAINIAGRIPAAHKGTVEIRPIVELPDLPEDSSKISGQPVDLGALGSTT
ncbi:MAG: YciI family protein [Thainema sp.]